MDSTSASLLERLKQPAAQASWARFVNLYTPLLFYWARRLGLQESDAADLVQTGLEREVAEEVEMPPGWTARPIGVLNNDLDSVGRVHFGLVYIADVPSPAVRVRETNKLDGAFATLEEIRTAYDRLETWSQLVVDAIDLRDI